MLTPTTRTRLSLAFLAAALGGCATQHFDPVSCKTWEQRDATIIPFVAHAGSEGQQKFSPPCEEGRAGATATLNSRLPNGQLHPFSAYVGKRFVESYEADTANKDTRDYAKEVLRYYHSFLKIMGNITYDDVLKALELKPAEIPPAPVAPPAPEPPKKKCVAQNALVMVCTTETPASAPTSAPASAPAGP